MDRNFQVEGSLQDKKITSKSNKLIKVTAFTSLFFFGAALCYYIVLVIATKSVADPAWSYAMGMFQISFLLAIGVILGVIHIIVCVLLFRRLKKVDKILLRVVIFLTAAAALISTPNLIMLGLILHRQNESQEYYDAAILQKDFSLCDKIKIGSVNDCYYHIFEQSNDPMLCEDVSDPFQKSKCYRVIATNLNDLAVCDKINNPIYQKEKYLCYQEIAQNTKDISICSKIGKEVNEERAQCYDSLSDKLNDPTICEEASNSLFTKDECYEAIALNRDEIGFCGKIEGSKNRDTCYETFAVKLNDLSLCNKIEKEGDYSSSSFYVTSRNGCYSIIAANLNDLTICDQISSQATKWSCYRRIGEQLKDLSICDKIDFQDEKDSCYSAVGSELADPAICDSIKENQYSKDVCYREVARKLKDDSICKRIQDKSIRRDCQDYSK